jgi:Uma2 family endonuclease
MAAATQIDLFQEGALAHLPMPYVWHPPVPLSDLELMALSRLHMPYRLERNAHGELEIMSPTGLEGGHLEIWIAGRLMFWAEEHGGIAFSPTSGFTLPDGSVRSPDASWVSQERWDALSKAEQKGFGRVCPEFLIELMSESDSRSTLEAKMQLWIANSAQLAWMIDPSAREVIIYRASGQNEVLHAPESLIADVVVPGFRLDMRKIWDQ